MDINIRDILTPEIREMKPTDRDEPAQETGKFNRKVEFKIYRTHPYAIYVFGRCRLKCLSIYEHDPNPITAMCHHMWDHSDIEVDCRECLIECIEAMYNNLNPPLRIPIHPESGKEVLVKGVDEPTQLRGTIPEWNMDRVYQYPAFLVD